MTRKRHGIIPVVAVALVLSGCGGGDSAEDREAVVQMLERLGRGRILAGCIVDELDGAYSAADLQPLIDARGDYSTVNFKLLEDLANAQAACTEESG